MASGVAIGLTTAGCAPPPAPPPPPVPASAPPSTVPASAPRAHQPGIVTPPPPSAALASFDVAEDGLGALLDVLAERIAAVHAAAYATVTVSAGASLFDDRFGLAPLRPAALTPMPAFPNDVLDPQSCAGDLLLQVCAEDERQVSAVLADLTGTAGDMLRRRWEIAGFRAENRATATGLPTTRNLFGFREGAGNPDPADEALMNSLVWVGEGEPSWAAGGTYQVVRLIGLATELWDRDALPHQEAIFGRHRADGAPLAGGAEDADFDYAADPHGAVTPLDAHIRRADPRTPETRQHRILRRSYSYRRQDAGLVFICFQRDPERGFAATQRRLAGEALDRYVLPFGGGYFFVPPSVSALRSIVPG